MPLSYSQLLLRDLDTLTPPKRRVRLALEEYVSSLPKTTKRTLVHRLRRLSQFMGIGRDRWPQAMEKFFAMRYTPAVNTVGRYRKWLNAHGDSSALSGEITYSLVKLTRALRSKGLMTWEYKHDRTQEAERRWDSCDRNFRTTVEEYLRGQRIRNLAPRSLEHIHYHLRYFGCHLRSRGLSFAKLDYSDALTWVEGLLKRRLSSHSINHSVGIVKRFYFWLRARNVIGESPFATLQNVRIVERLPKILTEREILRLILGATNRRDRAIMEVFYSSGCRVAELCRMDIKDVSFEERTAKVMGKGNRERMLYLNQSSLSAIRSYLPWRQSLLRKTGHECEPALFVRRGGVRIRYQAIRTLLQQAAMKAGLTKRTTPHVLRHTFACHMLNRGADLFSLMQFMGHRNIETTVRYLQVATARLSEVHRKYHPRR